MKRSLVIILAILFLGACRYRSGSGNIITEKRTVGSFRSLSVSGGFEVELRQGATEELTIEADDNLIKYIETDVVNGQLRIEMDNMNLRNAHLKVFITAPAVNKIKASAAAEIDVKDGLRSANQIELDASSGGNITSVVDAPKVIAEASSGGELNLSGRTRDLKANSSSGSSINAKELLSEYTKASASSGAAARVHASVSLDANASSGGNVNYVGGGSVKKSASSGGAVEKDN